MELREVLAPTSAERIVLVVVTWTIANAALARVLDASLLRWEVLVGGVVVFGWAVWAIDYRLAEARKGWYRKQR